LDRHAGRHSEGLMHGAAMRRLEESLAVFGRDAVWQVNRQCDLAHPMRLFCHGPFCLDAQPLGRDLMAVAIATHEITDTTCEGTDKEFDRTHAGILPPVIDRLVCDDSMLAARDVIASAPVIGCG